MKIILNIVLFIIFTIIITSCSEKTSYTGKIFNPNDDIYGFNNKQDVMDNLGIPNYIDPIERKYFYYSEKKISKNFFDNKIVEKKLIVFHFDSNDTIENLNVYGLDEENEIKFVKDQTESELVEQGLLEKIFGGIGAGTIPTTQ